MRSCLKVSQLKVEAAAIRKSDTRDRRFLGLFGVLLFLSSLKPEISNTNRKISGNFSLTPYDFDMLLEIQFLCF